MRLPLISPKDFTSEQKLVYGEMKKDIAVGYQGFVSTREDGALFGPWNPWLHEPAIGAASWALTRALTAMSTLPEACRQIVILVTGAYFKASYEVYAHVAIARHATHLSDEDISTIVSGQRPTTLTREEGVAYDLAATLVAGGSVPEAPFQLAKEAFGDRGVAELIFLVGMYSNVSMILNGFDIGVPESDRR